MPRKAQQGGKRSATPGASYTNRTDLQNQPVRTATGQAYGVAGQQAAAQQAVPLPNSAAQTAQNAQPQPQAAPSPAGAPPAPMPAGPMPGDLGAFDRPTDRPGEHVSTGLPVGPGAGPEALGPYSGDNTGIQLRALYAQYPNQDLADLIQVFEAKRNG